MRAITVSKLSRSMVTKPRSAKAGSGLRGSPEKSPMTPMTKGSSFLTCPSDSTSSVMCMRGLRTWRSLFWILPLMCALASLAGLARPGVAGVGTVDGMMRVRH